MIMASRLGIFIVFCVLGQSRKIFVPSEALWAWLSNEVSPFDFSVCQLSDFLHLYRNTDGTIHIRVTTCLYDGFTDGFTGSHVDADLPMGFFADLFEEGEAVFSLSEPNEVKCAG